MKLLKSSLLIITIFMIQPVSAKERGRKAAATPATKQTPAPTPGGGPSIPAPNVPSKTSFQYLLNRIRNNMASEFIINDQGVFTPKFENMIKSSDLAPELMEALMQAGRNLHLPLLGNNNQDLATIDYAQDNINRLIAQYKTAEPVEIAEFYNTRTNLFNQNFLNEFIASKNVTQGSQKDAEKAMIDELMPQITEVWGKRNISATPSQIDAAERQILRTIDTEFRKGAKPRIIQRPKAPVPATQVFYNTKTNLFNQDYLDKYISSNTSLTNIPQKDAQRMVIGELMPKISNEWKKRNIPMSIAQVDAAHGQIIRTIEKEFKKWGNPQAAAPQKEWYDGWNTKLLSKQYLDKFVGDALRLRKPKRQYENELEALEKQVKSEWEAEGIIGQAKDELAPLLNKQLEETANAIEQKRALKQQVLSGIEGQAKKINLKFESYPDVWLGMPAKKPAKVNTLDDYIAFAQELKNNLSTNLDDIYIDTKDGLMLDIMKKEFTDFVKEMVYDTRIEFPKINKPDMSKVIQTAIFIPNSNNAQIENSFKASQRINDIIDDIWKQDKMINLENQFFAKGKQK